jgi:hypothetical protein
VKYVHFLSFLFFVYSPAAAKDAANDRRAIQGTIAGIIERYYNICLPWRGNAAAIDTLVRNGLDFGIDDLYVGGSIIGQHQFDERVIALGKDKACRATLRFLRKTGIIL